LVCLSVFPADVASKSHPVLHDIILERKGKRKKKKEKSRGEQTTVFCAGKATNKVPASKALNEPPVELILLERRFCWTGIVFQNAGLSLSLAG
jgi:hypothetical protein